MIGESDYRARLDGFLGFVRGLKALADDNQAAPTVELLEAKWSELNHHIQELEPYFSRPFIHDLVQVCEVMGWSALSFKQINAAPEREYFAIISQDLSGIIGQTEPEECDFFLDIVRPSFSEYRLFSTLGELPEGRMVFAPSGEIRGRVVGNLVTNASRYQKTGSKITCLPEELPGLGMYGASITNSVDGIIPPEKLDAIFEGLRIDPTKVGSGLGLQNARSALRKYGGMIWAGSFYASGPLTEHFEFGSPVFRVTFGLPKYK